MRRLIPLFLLTLAAIPVTSCKSQPKEAKAEVKTETGKQAVKALEIEHLTASTFKSKIFDYTGTEYKFLGDKPCIIDFYASWCGPCRMMAPTLQTVAEEYKGKITVYKVDVDAQKELAASFGISGIPSILFCPKTEKPQMASGMLSKADFDKAISEVLLK